MNWNKSEIEYEVVKSFIPKDDLDCFLAFENIYFNTESIIIRNRKIENVLNG
jgi:hypothetical protein